MPRSLTHAPTRLRETVRLGIAAKGGTSSRVYKYYSKLCLLNHLEVHRRRSFSVISFISLLYTFFSRCAGFRISPTKNVFPVCLTRCCDHHSRFSGIHLSRRPYTSPPRKTCLPGRIPQDSKGWRLSPDPVELLATASTRTYHLPAMDEDLA